MLTQINKLSPQEVSFYFENGYFLNRRQVFNPEKLDRLTGIFEEHLANKGELRGDELDVPHFYDERLFEFLISNEVLDLVEGIIGPNIGLWSSHFISKEPKTGRRTPWHEDSSYWQGRFDRFDDIVTVWLAIDDAFVENGCMGVVPGSHQDGFSDYEQMEDEHRIFTTEIKKGSFDESKVIWFELNKGQCSLHDSRIIHGANANTSDKRRCGYTMRYFSTDLVLDQEHSNNKTHKIWHCRGENRGNNPLLYR